MRKILIIIIMPLCSFASASWEKYGENSFGDQFWYDSENIERDGESVLVWQRIRYGKVTSYGDKSSLFLYRLDCQKNVSQYIKNIYYTDLNWSKKNWTAKRGQKLVIQPGSMLAKLSNLVCLK